VEYSVINTKKPRLSAKNHKRQQGFTLLELMVVVGIMVVLGSMVSYSGGGRISDAKLTAVKAEMQSIRAALVAYKRDNFEFPVRTSAVDVSFLFSGSGVGIMPWDADYQRGWRGPYLVGGDSGLVDIGNGLPNFDSDPIVCGLPDCDPPIKGQYSGVGTVYEVAGGALKLQLAIPDPFVAFPVKNEDENSDISNLCIDDADANNNCLLDWRLLGQDDEDDPLSRLGRPYLFFNLNNRDKARLVSMGANGRYEGSDDSSDDGDGDCADFFPGGDDIIVCLY
jgi:prepilin-type N-terminal cleavage/methylation domain-containing protein